MDLIIRHAHLRGREGTWDIGITGDRIAAVAEHLTDEAITEVDAAGNLVMPNYVNGHIHLDKCFLQEGIIRDPGTAELMEEAMRLGADIVGGLPWFEMLDEDARAHIDFSFDLARSYDKDIHMLVDDTDNPLSRSLEYLAVKTMREGYQGRVSASHCGALAAYNEVHAYKVMDVLKQANVSISSNPHISLVVQGRYDQEPIRRGYHPREAALAARNQCVFFPGRCG